VDDVTAKCGVRVRWAASHRFKGEQHACILAHHFVRDVCPSCSRCLLVDAHCAAPPTWPPTPDETTTPPATTAPPPPAPTTTSSCFYDCDAGYANWQKGWSVSKKIWCCKHAGLACPPITTTAAPATTRSLPFDCMSGNPEAWPTPQTDWCCEALGRGCRRTTSSSSPPFDCQAGYDNWQAGWSVPKKAWCCEKTGRGCPTTTTTPPYDCSAGLANWEVGWSVGKMGYCCKNKALGCRSTPAAAVPYVQKFDRPVSPGMHGRQHVQEEAAATGASEAATVIPRHPAVAVAAAACGVGLALVATPMLLAAGRALLLRARRYEGFARRMTVDAAPE